MEIGGASTDVEMLDHAGYDQIEEEFNAALDLSLDPRGSDTMFDVISDLGLMPGAALIDVGCGRGEQAVESMRRFSCRVLAVDPEPRFRAMATQVPGVQQGGSQIMCCMALGDHLPVRREAADVVLCREMLYLVADLVAVFRECRRVLKPTGSVVVYQLFNTEWHEPKESRRFWADPVAERNATIEYFEQSVAAAGLAIDQLIDLRSETVEWMDEHNGKAARELRAAARLIRDPQRYIERFGRAAYQIKLNDALWFVNRMIGKLTQRIYVLRPAP